MNSPQDRPPSRYAVATRYLGGLVKNEDRAALATLRRGLGKRAEENLEPFRYLGPLLPLFPSTADEDALYLIASLFAWHPVAWAEGDPSETARNLGASFRHAAGTAGPGAEGRFVTLLNSSSADLPERLRQAVGFLKAHEVPVDWALLFRHVLAWDNPKRWVQRSWARSFWAGEPATVDVAAPIDATGSAEPAENSEGEDDDAG